MAYDKIIDSSRLDGALSATAAAIRNTNNQTTLIDFNINNGFSDVINDIAFEEDKIFTAELEHYTNKRIERVRPYCFGYCGLLETADFLKLKNIGVESFRSCYRLKALILRSEELCTLVNINAFQSCFFITGEVHETYNPNGEKKGYFYVPSKMIENYKQATNWVIYEDCFRAIEDYTVDGTVNGDFDFTKI